ncbi:carbohydrate kinase [Modestobacter sp. I12A-02662]|uniref:carbohydrate kinase family protein n=1 Tax=Modestobacter sp. I12A-02662 TaxID=1730496 RepID=UPI0034DFBE91
MICVIGELVVDLIPDPSADAGPEGTAPHFIARPGGNALNVAVTAGRLGHPVRLLARLGRGPLRDHLRRHAEISGVDVSAMVDSDDPVSVAIVALDVTGSADYSFHVLGAADWQWTDEELAAGFPAEARAVHVGSISSWTAPGCEAIARLVERLHDDGTALVSVDPNIRPMLAEGFGNTAADVHQRLDRLVAAADVVKVSSEDLDWLEPGHGDLDGVATRWAERGPGLVLLTDGGSPLRVARPGRPLMRVRPPTVTVADTVGAGDALAAGLLTGLLESGVTSRRALDEVSDADLERLVTTASRVAALTCTREGAQPPTRAELDAWTAGQP